MESNKSFAWPGYFLALLLFTFPVFDSTLSVMPLRLGEARWRFGAVGAFSNITLIPLLAILLAMIIASNMDHRRTRRVLGWLSAVFAVIFSAMAVVFLLDYFQARTEVRPQFQTAILIAMSTAVAKQVLTVIALALLARTGLKGPKGTARKGPIPAPEQTGATPLIPLGGGARPE